MERTKIMPVPSRKRPLLGADKTKAPPRAATTLRLERMLDDNPKRKKKTKASLKKQELSPPPATSIISNRWSQITKHNTSNNKIDGGRMQSVLASRGGLANAPGYRKASIQPRNPNPLLQRRVSYDSSSTIPNAAVRTDNASRSSSTTSGIASQPKENELQPQKKQASASASEPMLKKSQVATTPALLNKATTIMGLKLKTTRKPREKHLRRPMPMDAIDLTAPDDEEDVVLLEPNTVLPPPIATTTTAGTFESTSTTILNHTGRQSNLMERTRSVNNPPKTTKTTAMLLASTQATQKLLSGADENNPNLPKPAAASAVARTDKLPPAYQRHSDLVTAYLEEKEEKKYGMNRVRTEALEEKQPRSKKMNDNFVRQNLRNSSGSCRGARNKKRNSRYPDRYGKKNGDYKKGKNNDERARGGHFYTSKRTGLDPLDDYADGVFHKKPDSANPQTQQQTQQIPKCARHQLPCKLIVVKKTSTGNKGRKFHACCMPRGEQCNHFEWADDTLEAARAALAENDSSHSGFISRQVASYVDRFRILTVPELRDEAARRNLKKTGKKKEILFRLAIWVRDEIAKSVQEDNVENVMVNVDEDDTSSDEDSVSSGELKLFRKDGEAGDDLQVEARDKTSKKPISQESQKLHHDNDDDDSSCGSDSLEFKEEDDEMTCEKDGLKSTKSSVEDTLLTLFGHAGFRDGQEWAIRRCLNQENSLLVAPTGFGKSLCYALPAAMMDGISVVVSPLISLIQDQLRALPPRVPAATLSGSISVAQTAAIVDDIIHKRIKILFVSPERLASPSFQRLFRVKWNSNSNAYERSFPEISLLCIDEAHCVSQWAHNFRPCFLRFKSLLSMMAPKSILAITATAGPRVIDDICQTIGIQTKTPEEHTSDSLQSDSIKVIKKGRDNIDVSCQFVGSQEERLLMLSKFLSPRSKDGKDAEANPLYGSLSKGSVIVYVWRQKDTEVVAEQLASSGISGGVTVYHGGMGAGARTKSQSMFMRGKARICVATVAFGMGIDKADVVGVVHLYLSSSPEHYLQEIGRAGRDGRPANAIALPMIEEVPRRHSLEHSSIISKSQIKSLLFALRGIVLRRKEDGGEASNVPLQIALPVHDSVLACDCKSESIETLLSLIEQGGGDDPLLQVVGFNYDRAIIALKKRSLKKLAEKEPVAASIQAVSECFNPPIGEEETNTGESRESKYKVPESFQRQFLAYSLGSYSFSVVDCATNLGPTAEPRHVFAALRRFQSSNELELSLDTTDKGRVFHLKLSARGAAFFKSKDFDGLAEDLTIVLYDRFVSSIFSGAGKVLDMSYIMDEVATSCVTSEILDTGKSTNLVRFQELVGHYFNGKLKRDSPEFKKLLPSSFSNISEKELRSNTFSVERDLPILAKQVPDVSFATKFGDPNHSDYTALAVTKFLHGIDSPRAPYLAFRTHPLFGKWNGTEFSSVLKTVANFLEPSEQL